MSDAPGAFRTIAERREVQDIGQLTADEWAVVAEFLKLYRQARQHDRKAQITCYFRDSRWYLAKSGIAASGMT